VNASTPAPDVPNPFAALGGEAGVRRLVDAFYDAMERDPQALAVRGLHAPDLSPMRERLTDWLIGWMGGPAVYQARHPDRPCVVSAHKPFAIDAEAAGQWMHCMRHALDGAELSRPWREALEQAFGRMCEALVNR